MTYTQELKEAIEGYRQLIAIYSNSERPNAGFTIAELEANLSYLKRELQTAETLELARANNLTSH